MPSQTGSGRGELRPGIGDDAALLAPTGSAQLVVTCDAFLEGVHFLAGVHPPDAVGYKALVRATSDVAAMGAMPRLFLLTLALPRNRTGAWLDGFLSGMRRAASSMGMRLAGGDTTRAEAISISVTVFGEVAPGRAVRRSGARPGDLIYVSGPLGGAALGLRVARRGMGGDRRLRPFLQQHLYPRIRLKLGQWLARHSVASAMMDVSDGLSTDLARFCAASRVGARLWRERIPCVSVPSGAPERLGKVEPLELGLHGGEDYELLFTVPRRLRGALRRAPEASDITAIGEVTPGRRIILVSADGGSAILKPGGWDPFRRK